MELTAFRSLLMKLAWPVRHVLPQFAYQVSFLASHSAKALGEHVRELHTVFAAVLHVMAVPTLHLGLSTLHAFRS